MRFSNFNSFLLIIMSLAVLTLFGIAKLYYYYFPKPHAEAVEFLFTDVNQVKPSENLAFFLMGFFSPESVDDVHTYGYHRYKTAISQYTDSKTASSKVSLPIIEDKISIVGDMGALRCWLWRDSEQYDKCYTTKEVHNMVKDNSLLIKRYRKAMNYSEVNIFASLSPKITEFMDVQLLFQARNKLDMLSKNRNVYIEDLIKDLQFYQNLISSESSLVEKAIYMVMHGRSRIYFREVIALYPDNVTNYYDQIINVLNDLTVEKYNISGQYKKDFELMNVVFCFNEALGIETSLLCQNEIKVNSIGSAFMLNDFYNYYLKHEDFLSMHINEIVPECKEVNRQNNIYLESIMHFPLLPHYATYYLLKGGMTKGCEVFANMKFSIARNHILKVIMDIKVNNINSDQIEDYLSNKADRDYLTGEPYVFNKDDRTINFPQGLPEYVYQEGYKI